MNTNMENGNNSTILERISFLFHVLRWCKQQETAGKKPESGPQLLRNKSRANVKLYMKELRKSMSSRPARMFEENKQARKNERKMEIFPVRAKHAWGLTAHTKWHHDDKFIYRIMRRIWLNNLLSYQPKSVGVYYLRNFEQYDGQSLP